MILTNGNQYHIFLDTNLVILDDAIAPDAKVIVWVNCNVKLVVVNDISNSDDAILLDMLKNDYVIIVVPITCTEITYCKTNNNVNMVKVDQDLLSVKSMQPHLPNGPVKHTRSRKCTCCSCTYSNSIITIQYDSLLLVHYSCCKMICDFKSIYFRSVFNGNHHIYYQCHGVDDTLGTDGLTYFASFSKCQSRDVVIKQRVIADSNSSIDILYCNNALTISNVHCQRISIRNVEINSSINITDSNVTDVVISAQPGTCTMKYVTLSIESCNIESIELVNCNANVKRSTFELLSLNNCVLEFDDTNDTSRFKRLKLTNTMYFQCFIYSQVNVPCKCYLRDKPKSCYQHKTHLELTSNGYCDLSRIMSIISTYPKLLEMDLSELTCTNLFIVNCNHIHLPRFTNSEYVIMRNVNSFTLTGLLNTAYFEFLWSVPMMKYYSGTHGKSFIKKGFPFQQIKSIKYNVSICNFKYPTKQIDLTGYESMSADSKIELINLGLEAIICAESVKNDKRFNFNCNKLDPSFCPLTTYTNEQELLTYIRSDPAMDIVIEQDFQDDQLNLVGKVRSLTINKDMKRLDITLLDLANINPTCITITGKCIELIVHIDPSTILRNEYYNYLERLEIINTQINLLDLTQMPKLHSLTLTNCAIDRLIYCSNVKIIATDCVIIETVIMGKDTIKLNNIKLTNVNDTNYAKLFRCKNTY